MALNFKPTRKTLEFSGGNISLRGLSLPDLTILVQTHKDTATELYERMTGIRQQDAVTAENVSEFTAELIVKAPSIVAHVIALAADVEDRIADVTHLPFDVQASALEAIMQLTFAMEGGAKNFVETVTRIATGANRLVDDLKSPRN